MSINFLIGASREDPGAVGNIHLPPAGVAFARPFDIHHSNRGLAGRSTGGGHFLSDYETMEWIYTVGTAPLYARFMDLYNPVNPWVWVYFFDLYDNDGAWWEAVLQEPKIERGGGLNVIGNLSITFSRMTKYV